MRKTRFDSRYIFDYHFYESVVKKKNTDTKPALFIRLMYICSNSLDHKRCHNVMSKKTFNEILEKFGFTSRELLRRAFYPIDEPSEIEELDDDVERIIKHAIELTTDTPLHTIIFTSEEMYTKYVENSHFKGVKNISVKSGKEALQILNSSFDDMKN